MKGLTYLDNAKLVRVELDRYGDPVLADSKDIKCLFIFGMSNNHSNYVDNIGTDAHAYLDIDDSFVKNNLYRVEGMYFIINRYGEDLWYRIERSKIGRTILSDNTDNNVHVFMSKSPAIVEL